MFYRVTSQLAAVQQLDEEVICTVESLELIALTLPSSEFHVSNAADYIQPLTSHLLYRQSPHETRGGHERSWHQGT
jgi:hypothetical protein